MQFTDEQRKEIAEFVQRETLHNVIFPTPPSGRVFPLITRAIDEALREHDRKGQLWLPDVKNNSNTIAVYSDYGGQHKTSRFATYGVLLCSYDQLGHFYSLMRRLRTELFPDMGTTEYSFKYRRTKGYIARSMGWYLAYLDCIPGLLFVLIIDKDIKGLMQDAMVDETRE